ncbi:MAG: head GIN domain-containing protein [Moheibacter sp.]
MKNIFLVLFSLSFGLTFAQRSQNPGDFNSIEVYDQLSAELIPSDKNYVEVTGSNAKSVEIVNKNGKLKIRMKLDQFLQGDKTKVKIYYRSLNSVAAKEGAIITSKSKLETSGLSLNANKGATITLDVSANSIDARLDSGGIIEISGNANSQNVVANSGGNYEASKLITKTTNVTVNAGGNAEVYATKYVSAKTRAGGNIDVFGGAEVDQKTIAGGTVNIR